MARNIQLNVFIICTVVLLLLTIINIYMNMITWYGIKNVAYIPSYGTLYNLKENLQIQNLRYYLKEFSERVSYLPENAING